MRDITAEGKRHAAERGLRKVRTNVAQAIQRRKAAELCGLEELKTRVFSDPESDAEFELGPEGEHPIIGPPLCSKFELCIRFGIGEHSCL